MAKETNIPNVIYVESLEHQYDSVENIWYKTLKHGAVEYTCSDIVKELAEALRGMIKDAIVRCNIRHVPDGEETVNVSSGVWCDAIEALEAYDKLEKEVKNDRL